MTCCLLVSLYSEWERAQKIDLLTYGDVTDLLDGSYVVDINFIDCSKASEQGMLYGLYDGSWKWVPGC